MSKKSKHKTKAEHRSNGPESVATLAVDAADGLPRPRMRRKEYELRDAMFAATDTAWTPWFVINSDDKKRTRLNIITHLLSQVPYEQLERPDVKLPKRQPAGDYQDPNLSLRHVPTPF